MLGVVPEIVHELVNGHLQCPAGARNPEIGFF
jgi:hypothetical protein